MSKRILQNLEIENKKEKNIKVLDIGNRKAQVLCLVSILKIRFSLK